MPRVAERKSLHEARLPMDENTVAREKTWKKPAAFVVDAIVNDGKILLMQSEASAFKNYWSLPRGEMDFSESFKETALRFALKETGIDCDFVALAGVVSEIVKPEDQDSPHEDKHNILFVCMLKPKNLSSTHSLGGKKEWFELSASAFPEKMTPSEKLLLKEFVLSNPAGLSSHNVFVRHAGLDYFVESFHA